MKVDGLTSYLDELFHRKKPTLVALLLLAVCFIPWLKVLWIPASLILLCLSGSFVVKNWAKDWKWLLNPMAWVSSSFLLAIWLLLIILLVIIYGGLGLSISRNVLVLGLGAVAVISTFFGGTFLPQGRPLNFGKLVKEPSTWTLVVAIAVIILPGTINPLAQDNDGFLSTTMRYWNGAALSHLDLRSVFPALQASLAKIAGLSPLSTYVWVPVSIFLSSFLLFWSYAGRWWILTLSFIAAPVLLTEIYITRPQAILLAVSWPIFIILTEAIRRKSVWASILALLISGSLVPLHELSGVYALISIGAIFIICLARARTEKRSFWRDAVIILAIAAPYVGLAWQAGLFSQILGMTKYAANQFAGFQWNWWFIDSYKSVDGAQLGWPGFGSLMYYAYNGALFFVLWLGLALSKREKTKKWDLSLCPVIAFLGFFLFFAEVAPRFGFYFLLNRTWPYIILASSFLIIMPFARGQLNINRKHLVGLVLVAIIGLSGIFYVSRNNLVLIHPQELKAVSYIKEHTSKQSLIVSNQINGTLVNIYGERRFLQLEDGYPKKPDDLVTYSAGMLNQVRKTTVVETTTSFSSISHVPDTVKSTTKTVENIVADPQIEPDEIYYIFSYRKASGLSGERTGQYNEIASTIGIDFQALKPIFNDGSVIIYRIK